MLLLLFVLTPIAVFLYLELRIYKHKQLVNRFPGPPALPVLGNGLQMGRTPAEIFQRLFNWWGEYGKVNYRVWVGYYSNIIVADPKDMEFILTSNTLTMKSDIYDMLHPWLGRGLLTSYGPKWHKHRKMITPSFHFQILQNFHEVMNKNSAKFIEKLRHASAGETIFDFQEMVHYFTLDVICDTAMGVSINAMDNNDSVVVQAFKDICYNINLRAYHPIKRKEFFFKFMPDYPQYRRTLKVLQDFTNNIIEQRIKSLDEIKETAAAAATANANDADSSYTRRKMAFLDTLLTATVDDRPLTKQEIYEEVSTFMFEGHDTTTSGIAFAIYLLSRHPHIQQKVYAEQVKILGNNLQHNATFQEIADMKYLDMVIKEAQRLYPSVPAIARCTDQDYDMNGFILPKGASINLFLMAMGYNEKTFPDPYRCDPDRFDADKRADKLNPFAYVPFSAGPRNCVGQKFALLELKTTISKIVRTFEILPPLDELVSQDGYVEHRLGLSAEERARHDATRSKYDPIISAVLTLKSDNGIQLRFRER